jgi:hypothetical protein
MDTSPASRRIELLGVDGPPQARVRLRRGDEDIAAAVALDGDRLRSVAQATLDAVGQLLPAAMTFSLDEVHVIAGARGIVVVVVTIAVAGIALAHTGSALLGDDSDAATAKATLAATNRRLEVLGF